MVEKDGDDLLRRGLGDGEGAGAAAELTVAFGAKAVEADVDVYVAERSQLGDLLIGGLGVVQMPSGRLRRAIAWQIAMMSGCTTAHRRQVL